MRDFGRWAAALSTVVLLAGCGGSGGGSGGGDSDDSDIALIGLDSRPANGTCLAGPAPTSSAVINVEPAFPVGTFPNQAFAYPVGLLQGPDGNWYVLEQDGLVLTFDPADPNTVTTFIDIRARVTFTSGNDERGLLGMAFHPDYLTNNQFYLSYIFTDGDSYISQFDGANPDVDVRQDILVVDQPNSNHNGGQIGFGPDGFLYIGLGDGGGSNDPGDHGQDIDTLLGAMLRIDVDNVPMGADYGIPPGNPFAASAGCGDAGCPEIYAWGLRNPWRWNFDMATGDLWLGDVGQNEWEEIDRIELGGNYGWPEREGAHCNQGNSCGVAGFIDPVTEYPQSLGVSVTAGFVYRGSAIPELQGRLVFADHASGRIWGLDFDDQGDALPIDDQLLRDTNLNISSFGEDSNGELYFLHRDATQGAIYRIIADSSSTTNPPPALLSATGCVDPGDPSQPAAGMIPYDINVAFWSDNAIKQRFMALPDGAVVTIEDDGDWSFPVGSVLMKHFRLDGTLIETRLLKHHDGGEWGGYTYEWNASGTDAELVVGGKTKTIGSQDWYYPSGSDCLRCHTQIAGRSLGPETAQMNRAIVYPGTGTRAHQLTTLSAIGYFDTPLAGLPDAHARLPEPDDVTEDLTERARAYLHANCAQCHQPTGPVSVNIDFRYGTGLAEMNLCGVQPTQGDVGITDALRLAPGEPQRSEMLARLGRRDAVGMPPLGSNVVDTLGVALIEDWIASLTACP